MGYFDCCKGCHSTCKEYLDDKVAYDAEQAHIKAERKDMYKDSRTRFFGRLKCINDEMNRRVKK